MVKEGEANDEHVEALLAERKTVELEGDRSIRKKEG